MKSKIYVVLACLTLLAALLGINSCSKEKEPDDLITPEDTIPKNIKAVNEFIYMYMNEAYLWKDKLPVGIDPQKEADPFAMLDKMIFKSLDKWTNITDDAEAAMKDFQGITTTFGYSLALGVFSNSGDYFAVIKYVTPNSPAEKAGLKRGDILLMLNDGNITEQNYLELFYGKSITIGTGIMANNKISLSGKKYSITSVEMYEDPVNTYKIIDVNGKKVGYLAYTSYLAESHKKLDKVFTEFKQQGVTEMVLDLRYNLGGNADTPPYLGSFLAPEATVRAGDVFLKETWNSLYMAYFQKEMIDKNVYFNKKTVANLNLQRVFILTTSSTASASEATISGLMPYLNVVTIGTTTYGKYCGAALLQPMLADGKTIDPLIKNWLLSLVIYKFVNKDGYTDFSNGIIPKYDVKDDLIQSAYPFGDTSDPLLAKALEIITGVTKSAPVSRRIDLQEGIDYRLLPELTNALNTDYGNTRILNLK